MVSISSRTFGETVGPTTIWLDAETRTRLLRCCDDRRAWRSPSAIPMVDCVTPQRAARAALRWLIEIADESPGPYGLRSLIGRPPHQTLRNHRASGLFGCLPDPLKVKVGASLAAELRRVLDAEPEPRPTMAETLRGAVRRLVHYHEQQRHLGAAQIVYAIEQGGVDELPGPRG